MGSEDSGEASGGGDGFMCKVYEEPWLPWQVEKERISAWIWTNRQEQDQAVSYLPSIRVSPQPWMRFTSPGDTYRGLEQGLQGIQWMAVLLSGCAGGGWTALEGL